MGVGKENSGNLSPEGAINLQRAQREIQAVRLFLVGQEGIPQDCVAYHGTSLETLNNIFETGLIPGVTIVRHVQKKFAPSLGDVYVRPLGTRFPYEIVYDRNGQLEEDLEIFKSEPEEFATPINYAEGIAQAHRLLVLLGLPLNSPYSGRASSFIDNFDEGEDNPDRQGSYEFFKQMAGSEVALTAAVADARTRAGIIFGIKREAFEKYRPEYTGEDLLFHPEEPFLNLVSHISPCGPVETEYFTTLKQSYNIQSISE